MSLPNRYARRTDAKHKDVGRIFRKLCAATLDTHAYPNFGDYLIRTVKRTMFLVEVKNDHKGRTMKPSQYKLAEMFGDSYVIVTTEQEAIDLAMR